MNRANAFERLVSPPLRGYLRAPHPHAELLDVIRLVCRHREELIPPVVCHEDRCRLQFRVAPLQRISLARGTRRHDYLDQPSRFGRALPPRWWFQPGLPREPVGTAGGHDLDLHAVPGDAVESLVHDACDLFMIGTYEMRDDYEHPHRVSSARRCSEQPT